jgi:hypothetical protein
LPRLLLLRERAIPKEQRKKAPKGNSKSPWSLQIGIFKILLSMVSPHGIIFSCNTNQQKSRGNQLPGNL